MNAREKMNRANRVSSGKCPDHGAVLVRNGDFVEHNKVVGVNYKCPVNGCAFCIDARSGHRLMKLLR